MCGNRRKIMLDFSEIQNVDAAIADAIAQELERQRHNIELIASENVVSKAVMFAMGTPLTNKYAEGYPAKRYYGGCEYIDVVEDLALDRAKELFGAKYANVQPHSGSQANAAAYRSLIAPGDTVLGMDLASGGHLTHGSPVNFSGQTYNFVSYGVDKKTERLDYDAILALAKEIKPKLIVAGASAYPREIDFERFGQIAKEVGAYLMVDKAHIAGLVEAGKHQNPVPYADIVTTTTHKTLRGPRGGLILTNDEQLAKKINSAVFPGLQGGPLEHVIAGKAVAFGEALRPEFNDYATQVVKNAQAMAEVFAQNDKARLISGGTDNHLLLVDVLGFGLNGKEAEQLLDSVSLTVNKNSIPFETLSPFKTSGIRLGTPAITSRGFDETDAKKVAELILAVLGSKGEAKILADVKTKVAQLTAAHPIYE